MAVNGTAALTLLPPTSAPADAADKPDGGIERAIGQATADAVVTFYQAAIAQQERGLLPPAIKDAGGSRIAALALLQLDHELGDDDFITRAHHDGKHELRRYLGDTDLFRQYAPGQIDVVLDTAIGSVFEIVGKVVKDERAFRAARAN